jgi:hypothetical protein
MTTINHNGGRFAGEAPASIDELIEIMGREPLDPRWEHAVCEGDGVVHFFGNFFKLSHGYSIRSDDPDVVARLFAATRANVATPAYMHALESFPVCKQCGKRFHCHCPKQGEPWKLELHHVR